MNAPRIIDRLPTSPGIPRKAKNHSRPATTIVPLPAAATPSISPFTKVLSILEIFLRFTVRNKAAAVAPLPGIAQ